MGAYNNQFKRAAETPVEVTLTTRIRRAGKCGGLNEWTQHLALDPKNGVYVEEPQEPSKIQGGKVGGR